MFIKHWFYCPLIFGGQFISLISEQPKLHFSQSAEIEHLHMKKFGLWPKWNVEQLINLIPQVRKIDQKFEESFIIILSKGKLLWDWNIIK